MNPPKNPPMRQRKSLLVRLPPALHQRFVEEARKNDVPLTVQAERIIGRALGESSTNVGQQVDNNPAL